MTRAVKPVPVRPASTSGATSGSTLPAKPRRSTFALSASPAQFSVSLTTNVATLWPTQWATLTATANADVGPTPYYIRIYDVYRAAYVATCGSGTVCSMPVTNSVATVLRYVALVSDGSSAYPPGAIQATSANVDVDWRTHIDNLNLKLVASSNTVTVGAQSVLTATTAEDIGPSPFMIEIIDDTTHSIYAACPNGTFCIDAFVNTTATTHLYTAYLAQSWTGYFDQTNQVWVDSSPIGSQAQAGSMYVTWSNAGWSLTLAASSVVNGSQTVTATANADVGPTPYYIEIYSLPTNHLIGICGSGSTCAITFAPSYNTYDIQALVTTYTTNVWPLPGNVTVQASSNVVNA